MNERIDNDRVKAVVRAAHCFSVVWETYGSGDSRVVDYLYALSRVCDLLEPKDLAECGMEVGE